MTAHPCKSCGASTQLSPNCHDCMYISTKEAAKLLHVSMATFWRWVESGKIDPRKIGARKMLVSRAKIDNLLSGGTR